MRGRHDDGDLIARLLADRIEQVLDTFAPEYIVHRGRAYLSARGPKDLGSFQVNLEGQHRGGWYRFSQGFGGGPVSLIAYLLNGQSGEPTRDDLRRAFLEARAFLGMAAGEVDHAGIQRAKAEADERKALAEAEARAEAERRQDDVRWMWDRARPIAGTPAERYLRSRDIDLPDWPDALRWATSVRHDLTRRWSGAMLCRVDNPDGHLVALWRIYLTEDGAKAFGDESKLGLGPSAGGAVRLFGSGAGEIGIAEGVETALAVYVLNEGAFPVWAALSTSGMRGFDAPFELHRVRIYPDPDPQRRHRRTGAVQASPGLSAAEACRARLAAAGVTCSIEPARSSRGRDFSDALRIAVRRGMVRPQIAAPEVVL